MNNVIQAETAQHCESWHRHQRLPAAQQRPIFHEMFVACLRNSTPALFSVFIEYFEDLFPGGGYCGLKRRLSRRPEVEEILFYCWNRPTRQFGNMAGESVQLH